jgi:hypothetical protein
MSKKPKAQDCYHRNVRFQHMIFFLLFLIVVESQANPNLLGAPRGGLAVGKSAGLLFLLSSLSSLSPPLFLILSRHKKGLNNQRLHLMSLVKEAMVQRADICVDTLQWQESPFGKPTYVSHNTLWDVEYWNDVALQTSKVPLLVNETCSQRVSPGLLQRGLRFHASLFKVELTGRAYDDIVSNFNRAMRPAKHIMRLIEQFSPPQPYAAFHLRIEHDVTDVFGLKNLLSPVQLTTKVTSYPGNFSFFFFSCFFFFFSFSAY